MKIVTVVPLKKGLFKDNLTYFSTKEVASGDIVTVTVRDKKILGLAVHTEDVSDIKSDIKKMHYNLKKIIDVKEQVVFSGELLESIFLTAKYFIAKNNNAITTLLPAIMRENYDKMARLIKDKSNAIEQNPVSLREKNMKSEKLLFQAQFEDRISYYKTLIRGSFAQKKSVFIALPTEKDISEFTSLLEKGIENFVIPIHSGFSPKKQLKKIEKIIESEHPVLIIGTPLYLAISRTDLDTIIIEHENSNAYKMFTKPNIDLRTYVEILASKIGAKLILGDFLLRYETLARKEFDNFGEIRPISYRINFNGEIRISGKEEKFKILTDICVREIQAALFRKENVFIFSLRKGLATITVCKDCGEPVLCEKCLAPLVLYLSKDEKKRMFICNRCGEEKRSEITCKNCGSWNLLPMGIGTDTVVEELKSSFPNSKIFKLDKESAKNNTGALEIINNFENCHGAILVGTEMTFFYLKNKVPLSVIASFDSLWSIPNFRMSERIIQLMISVLRKTEKRLLIQTKNEGDPAIISIMNENLTSFVREELKDRKTLGYPPYVRFIKISYQGDKEKSLYARNFLKEKLKEYSPEIFSGFVARQKGLYSTNALIRQDIKKWSLLELTAGAKIDQNLENILQEITSQFDVTIDPEDLI